jgi:SHAQKYF class myb-like DNA-binding protein
MTISTRVKAQLFATTPTNHEQLIRLPPTSAKQGGVVVARYIPSMSSSLSPSVTQKVIKTWTKQEHDLFLQGLEMYPHGPWKKIADFIGSKTARQTMAHAQKYRQKIARRQLIWKTASAAMHRNSPVSVAGFNQMPNQHAFMDVFRSKLDFGGMPLHGSSGCSTPDTMSMHGSSVSSTPDTSDDEGWMEKSTPTMGTFSASLSEAFGRSHVSSHHHQGNSCGGVKCENAACDNCFFEREILPMLAQLDTAGLEDVCKYEIA